MDEVPPGWYANPDDSAKLRWWTGTAWSATTAPRPASQPNPSRGPVIAVATIVGFFALIGLFSSGIGGLLATLGFSGAVIAVVALVRGSLPRFLLRSRGIAGAALAASFVVMIVGGAVSPVHRTPTVNVAQQGSDSPEIDEPTSSSAPTLDDPAPEESTRREQTTSVLPFGTTTVDDPNSDVGTSVITVAGVDGVLTTIWKITFTDGVETDRDKVSEEITQAPVDQVTSVGSRVPPPPPPAAPSCDPNYSGPCVPIASDVDCAGGSGNGPAYVSGPVTVVGSDIYQLDRDGDGIACD